MYNLAKVIRNLILEFQYVRFCYLMMPKFIISCRFCYCQGFENKASVFLVKTQGVNFNQFAYSNVIKLESELSIPKDRFVNGVISQIANCVVFTLCRRTYPKPK